LVTTLAASDNAAFTDGDSAGDHGVCEDRSAVSDDDGIGDAAVVRGLDVVDAAEGDNVLGDIDVVADVKRFSSVEEAVAVDVAIVSDFDPARLAEFAAHSDVGAFSDLHEVEVAVYEECASQLIGMWVNTWLSRPT